MSLNFSVQLFICFAGSELFFIYTAFKIGLILMTLSCCGPREILVCLYQNVVSSESEI